MRTLGAIAVAFALSTGAALAQGSGSGGGSGAGGTETGPGGMSTGKEAGANPTAAQCTKGWDQTMRMTKSEFDMKCKKN